MPNDPAEKVQQNPFGVQARVGGLVSVEQQRAIAQVQAAILVARSMPRDRLMCMDLILQDCTDPDLAEDAEYEYSRGGSKIAGPSIRLLETVARRWGNMESGVKELSRQNGYSECEAYAWDMEGNYRDSKIFQVKHWRDTKQGGYQITDERDIYELVANMGARRKRACMETVIPKDVINKAMEQCEVTLKTKIDITPDYIKGLLNSFARFNVTKEMLEKRIQRHIDALTPALAVQLRRIFNSLKDGMSVASEWFDVGTPAEPERPKTGASALKDAATGKSGPAATTPSGDAFADSAASGAAASTSTGAGTDKADDTNDAEKWAAFQTSLAGAKSAEDLDYLRGLAKELNDDHQLEAVTMISRRAAEIAGGGAAPAKK